MLPGDDDGERRRTQDETPLDTSIQPANRIDSHPGAQNPNDESDSPILVIEIGAGLTFRPADVATFDRTVTLMLEASQSLSDQFGFRADVVLVTDVDNGAEEFVVFDLSPGCREWTAQLLVDETRRGGEAVGALLADGWDPSAPGVYTKDLPVGADPEVLIAQVTDLARNWFDPQGDQQWQIGVIPFGPFGYDGEQLGPICQYAPDVAQRLIEQLHGEIPDDPDGRRAVCAALGFDAAEVFYL